MVYSTRLPVSDCGTGTRASSRRGFSGQQGLTHFRLKDTLHALNSSGGFAYRSHRLTAQTPAQPIAGWSTSLRPLIAPHKWCRNVDRLSITYAFRPRLRTRLTRRGLTWRRKPWTFGVHGSHDISQHDHFQLVQPPSRSTFCLHWNAPLPLSYDKPQLRYYT